MREDPTSSQRTSRSWHEPTALATNILVPLRFSSALALLSHFIRVLFSRGFVGAASPLRCDVGLPVLTPPPSRSYSWVRCDGPPYLLAVFKHSSRLRVWADGYFSIWANICKSCHDESQSFSSRLRMMQNRGGVSCTSSLQEAQ